MYFIDKGVMLTIPKAFIPVKNLEEAIEKLGILKNRKLILYLWIDSKSDCSPIYRELGLTIPDYDDDIGPDILFAINDKVWIVSIMDEHKNLYSLTEPLEYANKKCVVK